MVSIKKSSTLYKQEGVKFGWAVNDDSWERIRRNAVLNVERKINDQIFIL